MRHVTIYTTDKEYLHFIELARNLGYVKKIETDDETSEDSISETKAILKNIEKGFKEMRGIKKGKLKTSSLADFLDEIQD